MSEPELEWLAFEASRHSSIVEIGCYLGRSTRALADNVSSGGRVYAIDNWLGPKEINPPIHDPETLFPQFKENLKDHIESGNVLPFPEDSLMIADILSGEQFDMVFIDASHDTQAVMDDIKAWSKLLKKGGLLCGHDAHWPGVEEARRLLLPPHMSGVGSLWAVDNFQGLII